ncbi:hypothetical protein LJC67_02100 [Bacteroidales bacterium OttesenSCG-928-A14]|nr:hypothetical protein [Bacteroidales bacterium OttesenSCG-928-A14]
MAYRIPLSSKISEADLPLGLSGLLTNIGESESVQSLLQGIYIEREAVDVDPYSNAKSYYCELATDKMIGIKIPGTEMKLQLNPNSTGSGGSNFPISFVVDKKAWGILDSLASINELSANPADYFIPIVEYLGIDKEGLIYHLIVSYSNLLSGADDSARLNDFVSKVRASNPALSNLSVSGFVTGDLTGNIEKLVSSIEDAGQNVWTIISLIFLQNVTDVKENLKDLLRAYTGDDPIQFLRDAFVPSIEASTLLSPCLIFPEKWLKPADGAAGQAKVKFAETEVRFSTEDGFDIDMDTSISLSPEWVEIGNTGLEMNLEGIKLDLSKTKNIEQATMDGRPDDFMGAYIESTGIRLPKKWFNTDDNNRLALMEKNILIGTGGFSGRIELNSDTTRWISNSDGFNIGFDEFSITFDKNVITHSSIKASVKIPNMKNENNGELVISLKGSFSENGDFNLTAVPGNGGLKAKIGNFIAFNFLDFEMGREEDSSGNAKFYLGTSCTISFPEGSRLHEMLKPNSISIPKLRIYSNGKIELQGGTSLIPSNISLDLGPVDMAVSGLHFGAYEKEGTQYNYWGFDGAISVNPIGLDLRGEGVKYYYPVDNSNANSFLRIETVKLDLVIPSDASTEEAMVLIKGMLSIPDPGNSPKYEGEISLKLPSIGLSAGASMSIMPREPGFIVDTDVTLPSPIPIGPVGIYGFRGIFGFRYVAEKEAVTRKDPNAEINTFYDYFVYPKRGMQISKFSDPTHTKGYNAPVSLGAGIVVGTSFDNGTLISIRALVLLSLPSMFVIEGKAALICERLGLDDSGEPPFFAYAAITKQSFETGFGADFNLPQDGEHKGKVLTIDARAEAVFPFKNSSSWYIHLGTKEKPIKAVVFPDLINLRAMTYLMISSKGIETAARVDVDFNQSFFGIKVRIYAFAEVGGKVSFEKPRFGGHIHFGGGIDVNVWKIIMLAFDLDVYLAAEVPKPAMLYAHLRFKGHLKLIALNIPFNIKLKLQWGNDGEADATPIPPIPKPEASSSTGDSHTVTEMVRGVHMLTNETFKLDYNNSRALDCNDISKVIPVDSYIEIKALKDMQGSKIRGKILDIATQSTGRELVPPVQVAVKGHTTKQISHQYSIESITVEAHGENGWRTYHPYEALVGDSHKNDVKDYHIGSWQITDGKHNSIRLLASNPFTFADSGEPGWYTPEDHGVNPSSIFCGKTPREKKVVNMRNQELYKIYPYNPNYNHLINGAYFNLEEEYEGAVVDETHIAPNIMIVRPNAASPVDKSFDFSNFGSMEIVLPEPACYAKLETRSFSSLVTVKFYSSRMATASSPVTYHLERTDTYYGNLYNSPSTIIYESASVPITKIVIEPTAPDMEFINYLRTEIGVLKAYISGHPDAQPADHGYGYDYGYGYEQTLVILENLLESEINSIGACFTSFIQLTWQPLDDYEYEVIAGETNVSSDFQKMEEAVSDYVQPIWRPDTYYRIHFQLRDKYALASGNPPVTANFDYYYGFKTSGALGHFVSNPSLPVDVQKAQNDTYNDITQYIDYKRSYPDASGSLLKSKPLFWGNEESEINLYFARNYAYHMFHDWPAYNTFPSLSGALNIKIKDPVSDTLIPYPLQPQIDPTVPRVNETNIWGDDENPCLPASILLMNNILSNMASNDPCHPGISPLQLAGKRFSVRMTNLQPEKLYTALLYNKQGSQNVQLHDFVFQTSRFESFESQVRSFVSTESGNSPLMHVLDVNLSTTDRNRMYSLVAGTSGNLPEELTLKYSDSFDCVMEGLLQLKPLDAAICTEFSTIRNGGENGSIIGLLIRNPEPFNDPKLPSEEITKTIQVLNQNGSVNANYKVLYSKDYSQAIIMKVSGQSFDNQFDMLFKYILWDGSCYAAQSEVNVNVVINQ